MFCSKCGKEIDDAAMICPSCGCATSNFTQAQSAPKASNSSDYLVISRFHSQAKTIRNLGIAAAILMFGIGFIISFIISFIIWGKYKAIEIPTINTTDQKELALFEDAKRKLEYGRRLSYLPVLTLGLCLFAFLLAFLLAFFA